VRGSGASHLETVIVNGTVITADGRQRVDIGIRADRIAVMTKLDQPFPADPGRDRTTAVIDAGGKLVLPGLIDVHTHFGLAFGQARTSDGFLSGTVAAASGGVTTVIDFATPTPRQAPAAAVARRKREASVAVIDYGLHAVLLEPPAAAGEASTCIAREISALAAGGIPSFKLYLTYRSRGLMASEATLAAALAAAVRAGGLVGVHAEDNDMVEEATAGLTRAGQTDPAFFAAGRPAAAEAAAIARACRLAGEAGAPLYIFHLSTAAGLDEIRRARAEGVLVWAETCPHYLIFTDEVYARDDGYRFMMNPPLRRREDVDALWTGLAGGEIQVVASDHCPFPRTVTAGGVGSFLDIPPGIGGTELILPLLLSEGVAKGRLSLPRLVEVTSTGPARLFGLYPRKGRLAPGAQADIVIVDPDEEWTIESGRLRSRGDQTPYEGRRVRGRVVLTMARGRVVYRDGEFVGRAGAGRFLRRGPAKPT
jgi:dihydropyrimidinase